MTTREKNALKQVAERISGLASMENASFSMSPEHDKVVKDGVRPYMTWFQCVASYLNALADANDNYDLENALNNIERYCD